ncbi:SMI1/KNR4 family protein [Nocardia sp. NPDC056100]|uniref:SMI1/KNR4 family protein n=1 Tax=Nocardia sp. NPDC056100 TaxID=3345712 RepID=UPI0035DD54A0
MVASMRDIFKRAVEVGFRSELTEGATDLEIDGFAEAQGVLAVPEAFREVLRIMGRQAGAVFPGTVFGVKGPDADTKEDALDCLEGSDQHDIRDPEGMLVISEAGGYSFLVIDGIDIANPDPPLWELIENGTVSKCAGSLTEWFDQVVNAIIQKKHQLIEYRAEGQPDRTQELLFRWD